MSCRATATIWHAEGVRLKDVQALNERLMKGGTMTFAELYGERLAKLPGWNGPFVVDGDGELLIADAEAKPRVRYGSATQVWACWGESVTRAIARHLVAGELVFEIMEEGQPAEYLVITPGAYDVRDDYPGD